MNSIERTSRNELANIVWMVLHKDAAERLYVICLQHETERAGDVLPRFLVSIIKLN